MEGVKKKKYYRDLIEAVKTNKPVKHSFNPTYEITSYG